ncbi:hypothetical protein BX666DRAFT_1932992 [Dichotomocladium elegans]|nr:hypothetical protein BX666DRAFT_1932992 [Dichotomocladium elegans]
MMPTWPRSNIASFNKKKDLPSETRTVIDTRQTWQISYSIKDHVDYDWVRTSVYVQHAPGIRSWIVRPFPP